MGWLEEKLELVSLSLGQKCAAWKGGIGPLVTMLGAGWGQTGSDFHDHVSKQSDAPVPLRFESRPQGQTIGFFTCPPTLIQRLGHLHHHP